MVFLALLEFDAVLHLGAGELFGDPFDGGPRRVGVDTFGDLRPDEEVERWRRSGGVQCVDADQPVPDDRRIGVDRTDPQCGDLAVLPRHVDGVADRETEIAGRIFVQQHRSVGDRVETAAFDVGVDQLPHRGVDRTDRLGFTVDLRTGGAERRHRAEFGQVGEFLGERRGQALETRVGDVEVGGDRGSERLAQRCLHRGGDDGDRADEREADHESRGRRGRAAWRALGVAAGDTARRLAVHRQAGKRQQVADDSADGCGDGLREAGHAEEDHERTDGSGEKDAEGAARLGEQTDDEQDDADDEGCGRQDEPLVALEAREPDLGPHRRDRGNATRTCGGDEGGEHGDPDADGERHRDGAGRNDGRRRRESRTCRVEERGDSLRHENAAGDAECGREHTDDSRLTENHQTDLANVGTDGPQEGEFPQALADDDREGVEDEECADEERDGREAEQHLAEDVDDLVDRTGGLLGRLFAGDHFVRGAVAVGVDCGGNGTLHLAARRAVFETDVDRIDQAVRTEERVGGRGCEGADAGTTAAFGGAGACQADQFEIVATARPDDRHGLADRVSGAFRRLLVDCDLARPTGLASFENEATIETLAAVPRDTERRARRLQRFAVLFDDRGLAQYVHLDDPHTVDLFDGCDQRIGNGVALRARLVTEGDPRANFEVDVALEFGEEAVDRALHAVGQHEGARDERDTEDDRERGEQHAELAGKHTAHGESDDGGGHVSLRQALHAVENALGRGFVDFVDDLSVGEEDDPIGVRRRIGVVRDHHDCLAELFHRAPHEAENVGTRLAVEIARGFVGEDDLRLARQRAGDGDSLLLATRQLGRLVVETVAQADGVDDAVHPLGVGFDVAKVERKFDVLARTEGGDEVEGLEHEPDLLAAQVGELPFVERRQLDVADEGTSRRQRIEAGEAVHEGRLARTAGAHDRGEFAGAELDRHAVERAHLAVAFAVDLRRIDRTGCRSVDVGNRGGRVH